MASDSGQVPQLGAGRRRHIVKTQVEATTKKLERLQLNPSKNQLGIQETQYQLLQCQQRLDDLTRDVGMGHRSDNRPLPAGGARGLAARVALQIASGQVLGSPQIIGFGRLPGRARRRRAVRAADMLRTVRGPDQSNRPTSKTHWTVKDRRTKKKPAWDKRSLPPLASGPNPTVARGDK